MADDEYIPDLEPTNYVIADTLAGTAQQMQRDGKPADGAVQAGVALTHSVLALVDEIRAIRELLEAQHGGGCRG